MIGRYRERMSERPLPATLSISVPVAASPARVWELVSDPATPACYSDELRSASWVEGTGHGLGSTIDGHNRRGDFEWTTQSTVIVCEEPHMFSWVVGDVVDPVATWTFEIEPSGSSATLKESVILHDSESVLRSALEREPDRAQEILAKRLGEIRVGMQLTVDGIALAAAR
jgi:uncharacterized protein YndB with AHSA1/START domain